MLEWWRNKLNNMIIRLSFFFFPFFFILSLPHFDDHLVPSCAHAVVGCLLALTSFASGCYLPSHHRCHLVFHLPSTLDLPSDLLWNHSLVNCRSYSWGSTTTARILLAIRFTTVTKRRLGHCHGRALRRRSCSLVDLLMLIWLLQMTTFWNRWRFTKDLAVTFFFLIFLLLWMSSSCFLVYFECLCFFFFINFLGFVCSNNFLTVSITIETDQYQGGY